MLNDNDTRRVAAGLMTLDENSPAWMGLKEWLNDAAREANEAATDLRNAHGQLMSADERTYFAARERCLRDLWADLEALRRGTFQLPESRKTVKQMDEEEEAEEE